MKANWVNKQIEEEWEKNNDVMSKKLSHEREFQSKSSG